MPPRDEVAARDMALLQRVREGDALALDALLQLYGASMIRFAHSIMGTVEYAQEVVQDVFLDLWRERGRLSVTRDVSAYLFWRTRNRAIDVVRADRSAAERDGAWVIATRDDTSAPTNSGERQLDEADTRARVWRALADVPPRCREVFMLVWDEQLSYADVAHVLGISVPAARNYMSRAVRHLAESMTF